jgi:hypothetical protein
MSSKLVRVIALLLLWLPLSELALAQFNSAVGSKPTHASPDYTMPAGKIYINSATIPKARAAFSVSRIQSSCTGTYAACNNGTGSPNANAGNTGSFRINCLVSHFSYDDPIVWPGQPGKTHLHEFLGNEDTGAYSDTSNFETHGNSTCRGGTVNRTGYWFPPIIYHCPADLAEATRTGSNPCDPTRNGTLIATYDINLYYKISPFFSAAWKSGTHTSPAGPTTNNVQWFPPGFKMISGNASNTTASDQAAGWTSCLPADSTYNLYGTTRWNHLPSTAQVQAAKAYYTAQGGSGNGCTQIMPVVAFPTCWDEVNLYLPSPAGTGLNAHTAYEVDLGGSVHGCPTGFPVLLPVISYNMHYDLPSENDADYWRLSSDQPKTTASGACNIASSNYCAGVTLHGDWVNGWQTTALTIPGFPGNTLNAGQAILKACDLPNGLGAGGLSDQGFDCHDHLLGTPQSYTNGADTTTNPFTDGLSHVWFTVY